MNTIKENIKSRGLIIIVAIVVVLATIGFIAFSNSPAQRLKRQLDLGQKYLNELDYEKAVAAFKDALEIAPGDDDAEEYLASAYVDWVKELELEERTDEAEKVVSEALTLFPKEEAIITLSKELVHYRNKENKVSDGETNDGEARADIDSAVVASLNQFDDVIDLIVDLENAQSRVGYDSMSFNFFTYQKRNEVLMPIISRLEEYKSFLEESKVAIEEIGKEVSRGQGVQAYEIDGKEYDDLKSVYWYLIDCYMLIGNADKVKEYWNVLGINNSDGDSIYNEYNMIVEEKYGNGSHDQRTAYYYYDDKLNLIQKIEYYETVMDEGVSPMKIIETDFEYEDGVIKHITESAQFEWKAYGNADISNMTTSGGGSDVYASCQERIFTFDETSVTEDIKWQHIAGKLKLNSGITSYEVVDNQDGDESTNTYTINKYGAAR